MERNKYSGKTREEAVEKATTELNCLEEDLIIKETESKGGLFKAKKVEIEVLTKQSIIESMKKFLLKIISLMGLEVKLEVKKREEMVIITIYGENNNILIGKQGRTIDALTTVLKQYLYTELGFNFRFMLDVGEYKLKNQKRLESLAKSMAKDVIATKIEVKLDPMNSYERRIIHTALAEYQDITTESTGEEPNRFVIIKPKKD